jgi:Protein of unknown function (DUF3499)
VRDLLDDDVVHEVLQVLTVDGAQLERPAIEDDARRRSAASGEQPGQRHARRLDLVVDGADRIHGWHVLDGEVDALQLVAPALLDVLDRIEHKIVEPLPGGDHQRHAGWRERAPGTTPAPVAASARETAHPAKRRAATRSRKWLASLRTSTVAAVSPLRRCSRTACSRPAVATLTYVYADSTAVVGPLATYAEPHSYDLCEEHAERLTVPLGWEVVRLDVDVAAVVPSSDDLEALANAVREAARPSASPALDPGAGQGTGRRGHLRVLRPPG